jgi:nucleoside-diphosphate-sugar epimerase
LQQLSQLAIASRTTVLFPTLVLGGDGQKPYSHLSTGLPEVLSWLNLIRFLKIDGSFHFIHSRDIAQVIRYQVDHPDAALPQKLILGNQQVTVDQCIEEFCAYLNKKIYFRLNLSIWLANFFIKVFRIRMAAWDRFCLGYRHFGYQDPINPDSLGLPTYCATPSDILRVSQIPERRKQVSSAALKRH